MSDKRVEVTVEINEENKVGAAMEQTADAIDRVKESADQAKDSVKQLNKEAAADGSGFSAQVKASDRLVEPQKGSSRFPSVRPQESQFKIAPMESFADKLSKTFERNERKFAWLAAERLQEAGGLDISNKKEVATFAENFAMSMKGTGAEDEKFRKTAAEDFAKRYAGADTAGFFHNYATGPARSEIRENIERERAREEMEKGKKKEKSPAETAAEGFQKLTIAALAAAGAASAAVAATAPTTWATFSGSLQLVSGEFANMLIPAFVNASYYLQRGAEWVRGWDDSTKSWVSTLGITVGAFALLGGAALKTYHLLTPIVSAFAGIATAARSATVAVATFSMAHPLVAVGTAVAAIAAGFWLLSENVERTGNRAEITRERLERIRRLQQPSAQLTHDDYMTLPPALRNELESTPADRREALFQQQIDRQRATIANLEQDDPVRRATIIENALTQTNTGEWMAERARLRQDAGIMRRQAVMDALMGANYTRTTANRILEEMPIRSLRGSDNPLGEAGLGRFTAEELRNISQAHRGGPNQIIAETDRLTIMERLQRTGIPGIIPVSSANPTPQRTFGSGEQFYADALQQIVGRGQLEQQLFDQQMRAQEAHFREVNRNLEQIRDAQRQIAAPPPQ